MREGQLDFREAFPLSGRIALVTDGGTGLGYAMAAAFVAAGARVVITGRRGDVLQRAVATLGSGTFAFEHDVTDRPSAIGLAKRISREIGTPTILVKTAARRGRFPAVKAYNNLLEA